MLQCVGSRDSTSRGNSHCSAICCLFATLHASLIRETYPDTEVTIAYTDLRMPGKAHEEYLRLVAERGVRYVRSRVGEISEETGPEPPGALGGHHHRASRPRSSSTWWSSPPASRRRTAPPRSPGWSGSSRVRQAS